MENHSSALSVLECQSLVSMRVYLLEKSSPKQRMKHLAVAPNLILKVTLKPCLSDTWAKPTSIRGTWEQPWLTGQDLQVFQQHEPKSACASSGAALRAGIYATMSGLADVVLVGGVEKMTHRTTVEVTEYLAMASDYPFEQWHGITFPGLFAMMATAHMHEYGTTEKQMAMAAVKNHYHGSLNPKAHMQKEITLETVMSSRNVAWPLKLYDCSLITDGASCIILTKPELASKYTDMPVHIIGSGQASDSIGLYQRKSLTSLNATKSGS